MASSSSSPACSRDGGMYVAVIWSGLNRVGAPRSARLLYRSPTFWVDATDRPTAARRTGSRAQRQRKSSCVSDMVSLPPAEASMVQALMDLLLPRFAGLGGWASAGPRAVGNVDRFASVAGYKSSGH